MPSDRLFGPSLGTEPMTAAVSDAAWVRAMLQFEAGLAEVEARLGLIPEPAAREIAAACHPDRFDVAAIGSEAVASASPVVPLVEALRRAVGEPFAAHVHLGATSQDALDTAMMLVARDGLALIAVDLAGLAGACAALARTHRDTPMAGRTLLQPALPITFGLKAAYWLRGVLDAWGRLADLRPAVQLGGPVGVLGGLGGRGLEVMAGLAAELGLADPGLPWHSNRGCVAEMGAALAGAAGAAAKMGLDLVLLSQAEVGEVRLARTGRSSAMAGKRNPVGPVEARAAFLGAAAQAALLIGAAAGEHERAAGAWQAEWPALSETFRLAAGAVSRARESLAGLEVDVDRMRANLALALGRTDVGEAAALTDRALGEYRDYQVRLRRARESPASRPDRSPSR